MERSMIVHGFDRFDIVNTPGTDKPAFTIWFAGCSVHCEGCHNQSLWDPANGERYHPYEIVTTVREQSIDYDDVVLLGGEPLEQEYNDMMILTGVLGRSYRLWLYTSHEIDQIPPGLLNNLYAVKTGRYDKSMKCDGILASSNQKLYKRHNGVLQLEVF